MPLKDPIPRLWIQPCDLSIIYCNINIIKKYRIYLFEQRRIRLLPQIHNNASRNVKKNSHYCEKKCPRFESKAQGPQSIFRYPLPNLIFGMPNTPKYVASKGFRSA